MKRILLFSLVILLGSAPLFSQREMFWNNQDVVPHMREKSAKLDTSLINYIPKRPGHYSAEDWAGVIDSTWGIGVPISEKLEIFDWAWRIYDKKFAAFQGLNLNWDSIRDVYRPIVANTENPISQGRFVAILNHMAFALKEGHTSFEDITVNPWNLHPRFPKGLPMFVLGATTDNVHFGASLTPLPDSTLLVVKVLPNHPLGLQAGDLVLGYDGIPWKNLYKELLSAQLPIFKTFNNGSSEKALSYSLLTGAGMNWHLFDTIDIVKYGSNDTLHFNTALLEGQNGFIWGNAQLPVPGIDWPDINADDYVGWGISWGIVENTQIGYIYATDWLPKSMGGNVEVDFYNAIDSLMRFHNTKGLIIDQRFNYGGTYTFNKGLSLLFKSRVTDIAFDERKDINDHFSMGPVAGWACSQLATPGSADSYYNKPIAVLTGPEAASAGDVFPLKMSYHPKVKTFGKSTGGSLSGSGWYWRSDERYFLYNTQWNAYTCGEEEKKYLARFDSHVDYPVWLTRETVAEGRDLVVETATAWIDSIANTLPEMSHNQYPPDGTQHLELNVELAWTDNISTQMNRVYFGKDANALELLEETYETSFFIDNLDISSIYYWRVDAVNQQGITKGDMWSFTTHGDNLALNKPVIASTGSNIYKPAFAVDGDISSYSSRWLTETGANYPHWMEVDLERVYEISAFKIYASYFYNASLKDFKVQYLSGEDWLDAVEIKDNNEPNIFITVPCIQARKVRLWITKAIENRVRLYEFEVYEGCPTSLAARVNQSKIQLYPNPATNMLHFKGLVRPEMVSIYNFLGQKVVETKCKDQVDISALRNGIYLIQFENGATLKFTKLE